MAISATPASAFFYQSLLVSWVFRNLLSVYWTQDIASVSVKQGNSSLQLHCFTIFACLPFGVIGNLTDEQRNEQVA